MKSSYVLGTFFIGWLALACNSSSDGTASCGPSCAGSVATAGAPPGSSGGSLIASGGSGARAGADDVPPVSGGSDDGHHYVTTPECIALGDCCTTAAGDVDSDCFDVIVADMP